MKRGDYKGDRKTSVSRHCYQIGTVLPAKVEINLLPFPAVKDNSIFIQFVSYGHSLFLLCDVLFTILGKPGAEYWQGDSKVDLRGIFRKDSTTRSYW